MTVALCVYSGLRLASHVLTGVPRLFSFFFHLFVYVFFGIAATVQLRSGELASTTPGVPADLDVPAALIIWLGVLAFDIGYLTSRRQKSPPALSDASSKPSTDFDVSLRAVGVLAVIGFSFLAFTTARVGIGPLFSSREALGAARSAAIPDPVIASIVFSLSFLPLLVASHALLQRSGWLRSRHDTRRSRRSFALGLVLAIGPLAVMSPIGNARYVSGTVYGSFLGAMGGFRSATRTRASMLIVVAALLFVFPLADAFRFSDSAVEARTGFFEEYRGAGDYDSFWSVANAVALVNSSGPVLGGQLLGVVLFWVPRSLWPGKPVDTGILLGQSAGYGFTNLSAPLWAELLVNFGPIGLSVGFLFLGIVAQKLDKRGLTAFANYGHAAIVSSILPIYMIILLRGSLLQATGTLAVLVGCLLFIRARGVRRLSRKRVAPAKSPAWSPTRSGKEWDIGRPS